VNHPPILVAAAVSTMEEEDPSATPAEVEHFGGIARQLTTSRRKLLEIIDAADPIGLGDLVARWRSSESGARTSGRAAHLTTGLLWKLEALRWIDDFDGRYCITGEGRLALNR
jgi:hypothetical protein